MARKREPKRARLSDTTPRSVKAAAENVSRSCFEIHDSTEANGCQNGANAFRISARNKFEDIIEKRGDLQKVADEAAKRCGKAAAEVPGEHRERWLKGCVRGVTGMAGILWPEVEMPKGMMGRKKK